MKAQIPEEITDLLKVRVNHDGESRDNGMWIASVSVYKALHAQQDIIARLEADAYNLKSPVHKLCNVNIREALAAALEQTIRADKAEAERCPKCGGRDRISNGLKPTICQHCSDLVDLEELEQKNTQLSARVAAMIEINSELMGHLNDANLQVERLSAVPTSEEIPCGARISPKRFQDILAMRNWTRKEKP